MYSESWKDSFVKWLVSKLPRKMIYFAVVRARDMADIWPTEEAVVVLASDIVRRWEKSARSRIDKNGVALSPSLSEVVDRLVAQQTRAARIRFGKVLGSLVLLGGWSGIVVYLCWMAFGG